MNTSELRVDGLIKRYKGRTAVNGMSLTVRDSQIVGLLGPNGAGKTTTFKMIIGALKPDSGTISLNGVDITSWPIHRRARTGLGYLAQAASIFRRLSVRDNLLVALESVGIPRSERANAINRLAEEYNLQQLLKQKGATLSGGERRRVEIARMLATKPTLVLFDEPFSGIDPITIEELQLIMVNLKRSGIGILITDHRVAETLRLCDKAYILNEGSLLIEGTSESIAQDERTRRLYLGENFRL